MYIGFFWESQMESAHKEDLEVAVKEIGWCGIDWITLAHDRDQ
jgi:hypothetical protein